MSSVYSSFTSRGGRGALSLSILLMMMMVMMMMQNRFPILNVVDDVNILPMPESNDPLASTTTTMYGTNLKSTGWRRFFERETARDWLDRKRVKTCTLGRSRKERQKNLREIFVCVCMYMCVYNCWLENMSSRHKCLFIFTAFAFAFRLMNYYHQLLVLPVRAMRTSRLLSLSLHRFLFRHP